MAEIVTAARDADYDALAREVRSFGELLAGDLNAASGADSRAKLARLRAEAARIVAFDFFGANGRETVEGLLATLGTSLKENEPLKFDQDGGFAARDGDGGFRQRIWVTRQGVHIDRIASAWLIRRFIDPDAQFKFVPGKGYMPEPGELRFDMFEAEFTHEGDRCTFEVLLARTGLTDPALSAIGEIVHDIDLKDKKFGREEASGVAHLVEGLSAANKEDEQRIPRGSAMLDDLYEYFRRKHG